MNRRLGLALFGHATDEYRTPTAVYNALDHEFHFDDDPCPIGATDGLTRTCQRIDAAIATQETS